MWAAPKGKTMADSVIIQSKVREIVKSQGGEDMRLSDGFLSSLNEKVQETVKDAIHRAKENGRKTLQAQDT